MTKFWVVRLLFSVYISSYLSDVPSLQYGNPICSIYCNIWMCWPRSKALRDQHSRGSSWLFILIVSLVAIPIICNNQTFFLLFHVRLYIDLQQNKYNNSLFKTSNNYINLFYFIFYIMYFYNWNFANADFFQSKPILTCLKHLVYIMNVH